MVYKFEKYGLLLRYHGVPVYVGGHLMTKRDIVWWWPLNWVAFIAAFIILIFKRGLFK